MAITLNGTTSGLGTTVTLPTHATGDLLVICASSTANIGSPRPMPSGWTQIYASNSANATIWAGWKIATSASETSGTWSNGNGSALELVAWSFSGAHATTPIGASLASQVLSGSSIAFDALTLNVVDGSSWVIRHGYVESATPDLSSATVSGYTFRQNPVTPGTSQALGIDSNGGVGSVSAQSIALGASYFVGDVTIEIVAAAAPSGPSAAALEHYRRLAGLTA